MKTASKMNSKTLVKAILALVVTLGSFSYGYLSHRNDLFPIGLIRKAWGRIGSRNSDTGPTGYWVRARVDERSHGNLSQEEKSKLLSIPYLQGTLPASSRKNVTIHTSGLAYDGFNLYVSGHGPEAILMDMDGRQLHRWSLGFAKAFPELTPARKTLFWRRARVLENGDLLAIYEYAGIVRLDANSKLIWSHAGMNHHDLDVDEGGNVYVLGQRNRVNPRTEEILSNVVD